MKDSPLDHLLIVAGAGVPRRVSQFQRIRSYWRSWLFKQRKSRVRTDEELNLLERKFGSPDYIESRKIGMRDIFIKTVQEDQSAKLKRIDCPTTLIYGSQDIETPPEIGMRLKDLIPNSSYIECPEFDHHSILSRGRHQLALTLREVLRDSA
jgi:pimeloyl-ACP methyl ester carboxylesterase